MSTTTQNRPCKTNEFDGHCCTSKDILEKNYEWWKDPKSTHETSFCGGRYDRGGIVKENNFDQNAITELNRYCVTTGSQRNEVDEYGWQRPYIDLAITPQCMYPLLGMGNYAVQMDDGNHVFRNAMFLREVNKVRREGNDFITLTAFANGLPCTTHFLDRQFYMEFIDDEYKECFSRNMCYGIVIGSIDTDVHDMIKDITDLFKQVNRDEKLMI